MKKQIIKSAQQSVIPLFRYSIILFLALNMSCKKDNGKEPTQLPVGDYVDVTGEILKNTERPFNKGIAMGTSGNKALYYEVIDWTVNPMGGANGNVFRRGDPTFENVLCLIAWQELLNIGDMRNGKLYQTVELEAGDYRFDAYVLYSDANTTYKVYMAAALGSDLPDTGSIERMALTFAPISADKQIGNRLISIHFKLSEKSTISLGFVADLFASEIYFNKVELWMVR